MTPPYVTRLVDFAFFNNFRRDFSEVLMTFGVAFFGRPRRSAFPRW